MGRGLPCAVAVTARFSKGLISPLAFLWGDRTYRVSGITARWAKRAGAVIEHHFAVQSEGPDVYELELSSETLTWRLIKVYMPDGSTYS
jgi:hypothetical protein